MFHCQDVSQKRMICFLAGLCVTWVFTPWVSAQKDNPLPVKYPDFPSEIPSHFQPTNAGFDHERRTVMIPMRDGVKLHTVILVPKTAKSSPMLLTRTCYNADALTSHNSSTHYGPVLQGYDNATDVIVEGNYIRVVQDIRGKYNSEGDYVMNRPISGSQNPTPVDHATDTYDTIDWLVKNVPESNGKVGLLGISYNGFLTLMGVINPHPALKVAVPMNPMVDGWRGDDWFHNGAFRQQMMPYFYEQEATRKNEVTWWASHFDDYDMFMEAGSAGALAKARGLDQVGFWRKILAHQAYDAFWQDQAMDRVLANHPLKVPMMLVHSLWDQEDIYGAPAVYAAIEPKDVDNDKVFLVMGPWHHGQMIGEGSALGLIKFPSDTSTYFRQEILRPFLDRYLQDDAPQADIAPVIAYETGTNRWREFKAWPGCTSHCTIMPTPLYLSADLTLSFTAPGSRDPEYEEFISYPDKPVPYRSRPILPMGYSEGNTWSQWLVDDQREASGRPDVLVFKSEVLTEPVQLSGRPKVNLVASTSGTDSDWVVKLIDVYPDEVAGDPKMGGYQLMIAADIFRGRYRENPETPKPITPDEPLPYRFALPTVNHVFLPGHRLMVQVQSSWFPLYDRNPQTFVDSIFFAQPGDYRKAVQRVWHSPLHPSFIQLPMVVSAGQSGEALASLANWIKSNGSESSCADQAFAHAALSKEDAVEAAVILWKAHVDHARDSLAKEWADKQVHAAGQTMKFDYRVFGEKPKDGWSLYISLHGGGNAASRVNDRQWQNQIGLYKLDEGIYVAPRAPTDTWNLWHQAHIDPLLDRLIEGAVIEKGVNVDRVYIMGYSAGGDGVYQLAPRMADRLAAAAMMAGHPNEASPLGLRNIGFTIHVGALDAAYKRNEVAAQWGEKLDTLRAQDPGGYAHVVQLHEGRAHWMNLEDAVAIPWMEKFTRTPWPDRVVWYQDDVTHARFYWLAVSQDDRKAGNLVEVERHGQAFIITKASGLKTLTLLLNDRLVNMDEPITIQYQDQCLFEGPVTRRIVSLQKSLDGRHDPELMFSAEVTVSLNPEE